MKKFLGILGGIGIIAGIIICAWAQAKLAPYENYSWLPTYSRIEKAYGAIKAVGIVFIVSGVMDFVILLVSKIYTSKTLKDPTSNEVSTFKCPNCGLSILKTTAVCPKCNTNIRE